MEQGNKEPGSCGCVECLPHGEPQRHRGYGSALLQAQSIPVDLIPGARDVSPGPGLVGVTSCGARELN